MGMEFGWLFHISLLGLFILFIGMMFIKVLKRIKEQTKTEERLSDIADLFKTLFDESADAVMILSDMKIINCNKATLKLFQVESLEMIFGLTPWELSKERDSEDNQFTQKAIDQIECCLEKGTTRFDWWHVNENNERIPVEIVFTRIVLKGQILIHTVARDISTRKIMEERLYEMSYRDQLTNLYNRRYFEEALMRMDVLRNLPFTVMMADVNGLKLINDSFGHEIGDQLLDKAARIIECGCREDDIIARTGGDEFAILLPKTNSDQAKQITERISQLALRENINGLSISIACGWETKTSESQLIEEVLKKAEDQMYKNKLFHSPSIRSKTVETIIQTLYEKNIREERHSKRVSGLCESFGQALNLYEPEVKELKSLGFIHDIGKIAIDDYIFKKTGKLTNKERIEIERHPEIGYRILSTVNEMSEMAEVVLAHHERWDGSGYPKGLKGVEIPFKARILSIADAYEAMTGDRSDRKAIGHDEAMIEIVNNGGIQFDPELVLAFKKMEHAW